MKFPILDCIARSNQMEGEYVSDHIEHFWFIEVDDQQFPFREFSIHQIGSQPKEWKDNKVASQQSVEKMRIRNISNILGLSSLDEDLKTNHLHCRKRKEVFV